jgi:hypothetical protein
MIWKTKSGTGISFFHHLWDWQNCSRQSECREESSSHLQSKNLELLKQKTKTLKQIPSTWRFAKCPELLSNYRIIPNYQIKIKEKW